MHFVNPTREQFKAIYGLRSEQPVCLLNLLKFKKHAAYESSETKNELSFVSGQQAYDRYSSEAEFAFRRAGGNQLWIGQTQLTLAGPVDEKWDIAFLAQYPTVQAFIDLVRSPEYQAATLHRSAALEDSRLIVCAQLQAGNSFAPLNYLATAD